MQNENTKKKNPLYICTKELASFDTEALFPFEGIEDTDAANQLHQWSSEEGSDTDGMIYYIAIIYIDLGQYSYLFRFKPK